MAGISLSTNFDVGAALPLDSRDNITLADMLTINENIWPEDKLVICSDDHKVYLFSKSNESDPITGKFRLYGSSDNDFTDAYKDKLDGIEAEAQVNTIESISVNGTELTPDADKNVDITIPDSLEKVDELPTASSSLEGTIYMLAEEQTGYKVGGIYQCQEVETDVYDWVLVGGGDSETTEDVTANTTVGGISSGDTVLSGTSLTDVLKKLLIIEIAPTTTFTASGSGVKEEGTSVTPTLTLNITNAGTGTPTKIQFYNGSTMIDEQNYVSGTNTYTYTMSAVSTDTTVKGVLVYNKSDATSATIEKSASYTFVMASYYGAVSTAPTSKADIIALTKNVKNTKAYTTTYVLNNQKSCYCYPASFGNLTSIKDANNFEYIQSYTKTNVSVDGVSYNVYTLTDPVTIASFKQIFA